MTHPSQPDSCFSVGLPQGPGAWLGARHVLGRHEALDLIHHRPPEKYSRACWTTTNIAFIVLQLSYEVPKSRFLEENVTRFKRMWNLSDVLTRMAALWAGNCTDWGSHTGWPMTGPSVHPQRPWGLRVEGPWVSTWEMNTASPTLSAEALHLAVGELFFLGGFFVGF